MPRPLAVITGASAGIGTVFARKLAAQGYDLLLIARRRDRLDALAAELASRHAVRADCFVADLSTDEGIDATAARIAAEPQLAMLVNNAGFGTQGRFWETPLDGQIQMHRVHMDAIMRVTHAALGPMVARNAGAIINVSSVAGFARSGGNVSYCATKAWINAFSEGVWLELRGAGSRVTIQALCPGFTYSEFHDAAGLDRNAIPKWLWMSADEVVETSLRAVPSGKLFVIPGWKYRLFVAILTKFPGWMRLAMATRAPNRRDR